MVAFAFDPLARAEAWLTEHGFVVEPEMGVEELEMLIDLAAAASEVTWAGHSREAIAAVLTAAFEGG